jgi:hypothetical protein
MTTKRRPPLWAPGSNAPESMDFSASENAQLEAMRGAWSVLRRTFEQWIVVGRGLQTLRDRAERIGGRKTFQRLRDQQGIGQLDKGIVSRLLKIMDNLPQVTEWHSTLGEAQQVEWASPNAVYKHCPLFAKAGKPQARPAAGKSENLARIVEQQDAKIEKLENQLESGKRAEPSLDEARKLYLDAMRRHCKSKRQVHSALAVLVHKAKAIQKLLPVSDGSEEEAALIQAGHQIDKGLGRKRKLAVQTALR